MPPWIMQTPNLKALSAMLLPSVVLALAAVAAQDQRPVEPPRLSVQAVRFFIPQESQAAVQTSVLAFVQVPYALAEAAGNRIAWQNTLKVFDAAGTQVYQEQWWAGAPASFRVPEAYGMESLKFPAMLPGRYRIQVTVTDSVTGRSTTAETEVVGFASTPPVSDLLLASEMRVVSVGDTATLPGEIARGNVRFITSPDLVLDGLRPNLAFLLEAYTTTEISATTRLEIRNRAGTETVYRLAPFEQTIPAGGGVIRGHFSLEGIPEGEYQVVASVSMGGQATERTGTFSVGSLDAAMARNIAGRNALRGIDEAYFATLPEEELDDAAEVLEVIAKPSELAVYQARGDGALTVSAKRQFLTQFWAERDLDKSTPANETRLAFYDAIEYANTTYGEAGRNARPGWKTDRGRVFVKYGRPDDRTAFPPGNRAPGFEIWRYTQGRSRFYIFADQNNFGNFRLIKTNDLQENSSSNWCEVLTPQAVMNDVEPYLGQRFLTATSSGLDPNSAGSNQILCS
jgi:GWxTD domain-containing protein